jgi:TFIIF-interacting CTD phosphatase-like protein
MCPGAQKLLVLDLDETLVFASETALDREADFRIAPYHVYKRPFLDRFIAEVSAEFRVAVWTSASEGYAQAMVRALFPGTTKLEFVWTRERCTKVFDPELREWHLVKKLKKLRRMGQRLEEVIVVDDSPEKHQGAYGNLVRVRPYAGEIVDDELFCLLAYLRQLRNVPNVRSVDKRMWRSPAR